MKYKKQKPPYRCNICNILLSDENWPLYLQKIPNHRCRRCNSISTNKYKIRRPRILQPKINYRLVVLNHYSGGTMKCNCCGESIERFLTVDHINNDGAKHRRENPKVKKSIYKWLLQNNFPTGYQILCMNCNFGKQYNNGICPHKNII